MKKNPSRNMHLKNGPSKLLESINNSIDIDQRMYKEDIDGSIAHATMLGNQKIISKKDQTKIVNGLKVILQKINSGKIYELAEVVKDLNKNTDIIADQSYSERQLFEKAYEGLNLNLKQFLMLV